MCPHIRGHWHHPANTIELVLPSAHLSPQPKRQIDQFSCFCTAHSRKSLYFTMGAPFPPKLPLPMKDLDPIYFMIPWAHPNPQPKWHLDWFSCFYTHDCGVSLYLTMKRPFSPPKKLSLPIGGIWISI